MTIRTTTFICLALVVGPGAQAADAPEQNSQASALERRVSTLESIQPGLGVVMHEMGYRFANIYWAANGGNWDLAQYQLKELREAQDVGKVTRPQRAPMLAAYDESHLVPLSEAIGKKDITQFNRRFTTAMQGCNACHTALGFGYIRYRVPQEPREELLDFSAGEGTP
ncbi:MAG: hypothetical protein ACOZAI_08515 [Pseudomonadota bacterium]